MAEAHARASASANCGVVAVGDAARGSLHAHKLIDEAVRVGAAAGEAPRGTDRAAKRACRATEEEDEDDVDRHEEEDHRVRYVHHVRCSPIANCRAGTDSMMASRTSPSTWTGVSARCIASYESNARKDWRWKAMRSWCVG